MPRLTPNNYLKTYDRLRRLWLRDPRLFAELTPKDQWFLFDYFQLHRDLTDLQLLQHREQVTKARPSLPHQAGRALAHFWEVAAREGLKRVRATNVPTKVVPQKDRSISVKPLVQPEIDIEKLARAFLRLAEDMKRRRSID